MESETPVAPADRVGLGMELRQGADSDGLHLPQRLLFGWLLLESLELRVPPAHTRRANGQPVRAVDYQRVRTEVSSARLAMRQEHIDAYVAECGPALAALGVDELVLRSCDGYLGLSARVRESALVADLSARLYLSSSSDQLRISCGQPRVYGHLDTPAPILAHRLMLAIFRGGEFTEAAVLGLGDFAVRPLHIALLRALPAAGWRLPRQSGLRIVSAKLDGRGGSVGFQLEGEPVESGAGQAAATLTESLDRFRAPDALLQRGDLEGAMRGYRGELAARGPEQPFLVERILSIASANRHYFMDGMELARQVLGRWPDFAPAHAAIASIAVAQGDVETGAARYRSLSQASATVGDDEGTVRAALAGARLLRQFAPDESTLLYELVLEHRPGHAESAEALADRYRDEQRWADLVRLIRLRLATTEAAEMQARDHARLAEVLAIQLGDPQSALAELVAACRLDSSIPGVHEQRAEVELMLGDSAAALTSLQAANRLHALRDDTRARLRNLNRGGKACLESQDFAAAETWFLEALELSVSDSQAMRGAAQAAAGLGQHRDAARLWRELIDAGVEVPRIQAHFACELGRSLLAAGSAADAKAPLQRATETGGPRTRAEAHALLAEIKRAYGNPEEALDHLQEAIVLLASSEPDEAYFYADSSADRRQRSACLSLERAALAIDEEEQEDAIADLKRAFANARPGGEVRKRAARQLLQRTPSNAGELSWLDELAEENLDVDESAYLSIRRAAILEGTGDRDSALAALASALDNDEVSDPPRRAALLLKAELLEAMGESKARADVLAQRAALSGSNAQRAAASIEAAHGWLAAGDLERSVVAVREALQTLGSADDSGSIELRRAALLCLGECSWKGRAWPEVHEAYQALYSSRMAEGSPEHFLRWGTALEKLGRADQASEILEMVVAADESDSVTAQACRLLGHLLEGLGRFRDAGAAQERFASAEASALSDPARADAWFRAGCIYRRDASLIEDARRCMDIALGIASAHLPALDALEQIARDQDDNERLAVILGRKVAAMGRHPQRQRGLLIRLAELQEHVLDRMDVARETYRRVLEMAPAYRPALRFAARDARNSGNLPFACEALARLAGDLPDDDELPLSPEELASHKQDCLLSLASLIESTAGQAQPATVSLLLERARAQDDDRLWRALEVIYRRRQDLVGLADVLGQRAPHQDDAQALKGSLERIDILVNQLADFGGAQIALGIAQKRHPDSPQLARWKSQLDSPTEPPHDSSEPSSQEAASDSDFDSSNPNLVARHAKELLDSGDWARARKLLGPFASSDDPSELLWLHVEAALGSGEVAHALTLLPTIAMQARDAQDVPAEHRAVRRLADLILESGGSEESALALYGRALELVPDDLIAAELYAELLQGTSDEGQEVAAREVVLDIARRTDAGPMQEALALRPLAQKAWTAGDMARSIELYERAIELAPNMLGLYREVAEAAEAAGDLRKAVAWLEALASRQADGASDPSYHGESLGDLYLRIAEMYYNQLFAPDKARQCMRRAAESFGAGVRRNATLRQLASEADGAGSLEQALEAYEAIGVPQLSAHERLICARLYQRLGRDHAAVEILESARLAGTLPSEGRSLLFALHRQRARNVELAEALESGAARAPSGIAITRLREALRIYRDILANDAATHRIEEALQFMKVPASDIARRASIEELERAAEAAAAGDDSSVAASLLGRAIQAHCQDLASAGDSLDELAGLQLAKLRALVARPTLPIARSGAREVDALVAALVAAAGIEDDQQRAADYLVEVAGLQRHQLHDTRAAADALAQALAMRADDSSILAELASLLREAGDFTQLASAYELHLSVITGPRRAGPLVDLGRLCQHIFREDARARRCYREALELDSSLADSVEELLAALDGPAILADASAQDISHELDRAAALEALGKPEEAQAVYESAAAMAPGDSRAFEALRRIYGSAGEHEKLSRVLEQLTTLSTSRQERASLFYDRAMLARNVFHDDVLVYDYLKEAAANDPAQPRYSHDLRSIAMARAEWALAAELTYREIAAAEDDDERGALFLELALIFDEKLLDANQAIVNYEQALLLDPSIPAAPRPLARLYELAGRHADATAMYRQAASVSPDPTESARLLRHAAMNAEQAGLPVEAKEIYEEVTKTGQGQDSDAARVAADRLDSTDAAGAAPDQESSVAAMESRLEGIDDPRERAAVLFEIGCAYQHDLQDLNAAVGAYEKALDADPEQVQAIDALADIAYQQRDWPRAQRLYHRLPVDRSALPAMIVSLRRAEIAESLGQEQAAFEAFQAAYAFAPNATQILEGLSRSATRVGQHHEALKAQSALVKLIPVEEVERLRQARLGLGKLAEKIGDRDGAIATYELMLRDEPDAVQALRVLPRLYLEAGRVADATRAQQALVHVTPSPADRARLLHELGEMYGATDAELAADAYLKAIDLDPTHVPTLRKLLHYYCELGEFQAACEMARDLEKRHCLLEAETGLALLYRTAVAASLTGHPGMCKSIGQSLGEGAPEEIARALRESFAARSDAMGSTLDWQAGTQAVCAATGDSFDSVLAVLETNPGEHGNELLAKLTAR